MPVLNARTQLSVCKALSMLYESIQAVVNAIAVVLAQHFPAFTIMDAATSSKAATALSKKHDVLVLDDNVDGLFERIDDTDKRIEDTLDSLMEDS
jgi:hypothetical protein